VTSPTAASGQVDIRLLGPDDLALMSGLLDLFGEAFREQDTYGANRPTDSYLRRLLASDTFIALAALTGDQVVGGLASYELRKFERARSEIYVHHFDIGVS
jgi:aminoglycoside 3-N-acetyltransferase I